MDEAAAGGKGIGLSPMSLAEIVYLVEKGRLPAATVGFEHQDGLVISP
jgi:hypothetical protein